MAEIEFDVKVDNTKYFLEALPSAIRKALTSMGMACETYAKRDCPVDTGRLRNSMKYEVVMDEEAVYIGTEVEYGKYVELGTSKMRAQPFLKPAATEHTEEYRSLAEDALKG